MPDIEKDELAVIEFLLEELERRVSTYDAELREHVVEAANRLYDLTNND